MVSARGPMKMKPDFSTTSAKSAFLGEEAVARVDGDGTGHLGGGDDGRHIEVGLTAGRFSMQMVSSAGSTCLSPDRQWSEWPLS
jgi:hypothetical protein